MIGSSSVLSGDHPNKEGSDERNAQMADVDRAGVCSPERAGPSTTCLGAERSYIDLPIALQTLRKWSDLHRVRLQDLPSPTTAGKRYRVPALLQEPGRGDPLQ